ncbi:hypothetical protein V6N11_084365 [Hibiscus sabdariffa]|uniref:Uncharacterized protein n=1 Tax=Hibiscus sabdariffa TaxID=183260 RepID=A0ABR2QSN4_9ROSI
MEKPKRKEKTKPKASTQQRPAQAENISSRYFTASNSCKNASDFPARTQLAVKSASETRLPNALEIDRYLLGTRRIINTAQRHQQEICPLYKQPDAPPLFTSSLLHLLLFLFSFAFKLSKILSYFSDMANSARYAMVAARSKWEEQGFHFDDNLPNYGLEQFLYNRLNELGWFRLARQPGRANYNWVLKFYANNADGEDFSIVRDRRVPATAATSNALLGLPNDNPSFYAMLGGFEEEDFEVIKDFLCQPNTE